MVRRTIVIYVASKLTFGAKKMLYHAYEFQKLMLSGAGFVADAQAKWLTNPANPMGYIPNMSMLTSALEVFAHSAETRGKPKFRLNQCFIDGIAHRVEESIECRQPFGQLKHFERFDPQGQKIEGDPKLLIVAPMSGHFATLLRGTVERMLPGHDVWITDWRDARDVSLSEGQFDLNDYVNYLVKFMEYLGPNTHMLAVCQPSVPALAASAIMGRDNHECRPSTLTMMGGPIDTRRCPTAVNTMAVDRPHSWFKNTVIATVPAHYAGAGRNVYPGFMQLASFMSMNLGNHMKSHWEMFKHLVSGDEESADDTKEFYNEYRSVCDMTAEFYLQTVDIVFQRHLLPDSLFEHEGHLVDMADIKDTALLAIEGERDDISGIGQTKAALEITTSLADDKKKYLLAEGAGHYGIFNGKKWRKQIAPVVEQWILDHNS